MLARIRPNSSQHEEGATMLEFAIVLPLLLAFIFTTIDFSRVITNRIIISNSLRTAARFAALQRTNCRDAAEQRLALELIPFGMENSVLSVNAVKETSAASVPVLRVSATATVSCILCPILQIGYVALNQDQGQFNFSAQARVPLEESAACGNTP